MLVLYEMRSGTLISSSTFEFLATCPGGDSSRPLIAFDLSVVIARPKILLSLGRSQHWDAWSDNTHSLTATQILESIQENGRRTCWIRTHVTNGAGQEEAILQVNRLARHGELKELLDTLSLSEQRQSRFGAQPKWIMTPNGMSGGQPIGAQPMGS